MDARFLSFYYRMVPGEERELSLSAADTCLLVIDLQNTYRALGHSGDRARDEAWAGFSSRLEGTVLPNVRRLEDHFRKQGARVIFARIACHLSDGADRSLSQRLSGWNNVLLPKDSDESRIIPEVAPLADEIVVTKTTDSALTGTNLRLILRNLGIRTVVCAGIFTDQCVASTVRSLSDESFMVAVPEDACAAGTMQLHEAELTIMNHIYCEVLDTAGIIALMKH